MELLPVCFSFAQLPARMEEVQVQRSEGKKKRQSGVAEDVCHLTSTFSSCQKKEAESSRRRTFKTSVFSPFR